jgi:hypothetical protein
MLRRWRKMTHSGDQEWRLILPVKRLVKKESSLNNHSRKKLKPDRLL